MQCLGAGERGGGGRRRRGAASVNPWITQAVSSPDLLSLTKPLGTGSCGYTAFYKLGGGCVWVLSHQVYFAKTEVPLSHQSYVHLLEKWLIASCLRAHSGIQYVWVPVLSSTNVNL